MNVDFSKTADNLVPAIIQDSTTGKVLMLGYMNEEALDKTEKERRVTFYSRSKKRLWTKGEESGNYLNVVSIKSDCDNDSLLIMCNPVGPVCHTGSDTCWNEKNESRELDFLQSLQDLIEKRKVEMPKGSYTTSLFTKGTRKITQKVGEEAVETIIGAMANDDENFIYEGADLIYHLIVLLTHKGYRIEDLIKELQKRHK
ncbi:bifunctional phosphoribosyl-AMP cyclohydrolase/phosphoribosyl-ATP diphosphatase HisIE [Marinilabiliaceae bacterium ANBcel2]|nr:bifunctional phosphoribosyl-AMP cyclohydrolase/phosphoribosyl-ATP diphosphatase HisIE [Marinilabiliaceae bacterium ANBcel2]